MVRRFGYLAGCGGGFTWPAGFNCLSLSARTRVKKAMKF